MAAGEFCVLFTLVCLNFLTFSFVSTCGVTTHIEIAHRAVEHFQSVNAEVHTNYEQLIRKHPDAFQGGAPYPDAYYPNICFTGNYHNVAEDSHWVPFMNATINYIRHHFPRPWDEATEKLVVFLFGFASHQVADVSWHSLGIDQGFLRAMSKIDFHDVFNIAHPIGDFGGDILTQYELKLPYIGELAEWYIPVLDLEVIYREFYGRQEIPIDVIIECTLLLYLERLGEDVAVAELYIDYAKKSPFLEDRFEDYYLGGLDDMAAQTQNTWQHVGFMLEHGTSECSIPHNPLYISCGQNRSVVAEGELAKNGRFVRPRLAVRGVDFGNVQVTKKWRGITLKPSKKHLRLRKKLKSRVTQKVHLPDASATNVQATYSFSQQYSKFGWSLVSGDLNNDGNADLIIGAPGWGSVGSIQQGRVFVIYGTKDGLPVKTTGDVQTVNGPHQGQSKFGASVAAVDVNLDGITDLVVGAPSFSNNGSHIDYNGKVYIYYGSHAGIVDSPNMTISCQNRYCNLGLTLTMGDLNGDGHPDLLIGSPYAPGGGQQRGLVGGLYSSQKYTSADAINIQLKQLDWIKYGDQDYGWFGESFVVRNSWIVIGQPVFRICANKSCQFSPDDRQSVGKVHIFRASSKGPVLTTTLIGSDVFGQFGTGLSIGHPFDKVTDVLAVSSVSSNVSGKFYAGSATFTQAGEVFLYNLTQLARGGDSLRVHQLSPVTTFSGNRRFGRFGAKLLFSDLRHSGFDDLVITSPFYSEDISDLIGPEAEQGRVFVFNGGVGFPRGDATAADCQGNIQPCPEEKSDVFLLFNGDEGRARFGSSVAAVSATKQTLLAVGATHSSYQSIHMQGAVGIHNFPSSQHFRIKGSAKNLHKVIPV